MDDAPTLPDAEERESNVRMISESAASALGRADFSRIRALRFTLPGFDRAQWREFAELGWLALRLPEARDGLGMGLTEYCALARQLGRALAPEPLVEAVAALELLPDASRAEVLAGERIVLPAFAVEGRPPPELDGKVLRGVVEHVPMGAGADAFVVVMGEDAALVAADAPGLRLEHAHTHDGGHVTTLRLDGVLATPLPGARISMARRDATLATAACLLGVAERSFEITLDYLKQRKQFDRPIGAFQSLQHRMVDLYLQLSLLRASVSSAASTLDTDSDSDAAQAAVSRASHRADVAARMVCREAIQLHGAIGFTDEGDPGLFLRKTMVLAGRYGSARAHRARAFAARGEDA